MGTVVIDGVEAIQYRVRIGDRVELHHFPRWPEGASYQCDADTTKGHQCQHYNLWRSKTEKTKPAFCSLHSTMRLKGKPVAIHPKAYCRKDWS